MKRKKQEGGERERERVTETEKSSKTRRDRELKPMEKESHGAQFLSHIH